MITMHTRTAMVSAALLALAACSAGQEQYKRVGRDAISRIAGGNTDRAITELSTYLAEHPDDAETLFCLAVAHAQKQEITASLRYAKQAVAAGLPAERFTAGPREFLRPLTESTAYREWAASRVKAFVHGPILGCVTETSARLWVRTAHEVPVQVSVREAGPASGSSSIAASRTVAAETAAETDFTAVLAVDGLRAGSAYQYTIAVDGEKQPGRWRFRTYPPAGKPAVFDVAFGGGGGYTPQNERMWDTIRSHDPLAFLFLGDNVYIDDPAKPAVQRYCYYRRQSRPEFRAFAGATSIYSIWDDHDFTTDDQRGGPEIDVPAWKRPVWRLYRENWVNPAYGGGEEQPGCWFDFFIADVHFIMLDGRYYRENPKKPNTSMLGPVQKAWLFDRLAISNAAFTVLASPVPWALGTKPGSLDTWDGYAQEREEIFSFLEAKRIDGVILISADRHRSDFWKIVRPKGYDLYEFESSRLTNIHRHGTMQEALFSYNAKCSFGMLCFDTAKNDPEVTFRIFSIDDEPIQSMTLTRSTLSHTKERGGTR